TPGTSASLAANMTGSWDTTGYGVERDHTIKLEGAAGTNQAQTSRAPTGMFQTQFSTSNTLTVPAAANGSGTLTLNATLLFRNDHTVLTQIDRVYGGSGTGGGSGGGGGGSGGGSSGSPPPITVPPPSQPLPPSGGNGSVTVTPPSGTTTVTATPSVPW